VRQTLFHDDRDYARFLRYLATAIERFAWRCHSYCLIPNHYHVLLEVEPPTLGRGMLVVAGPYDAEPVGRESHLLETFRYIAANPVRAGLCERPADWRWSSYRATAGIDGHHPPWLRVDFARALFEPYGGYAYFCNPVATELQPGC
jgi:putative transposase